MVKLGFNINNHLIDCSKNLGTVGVGAFEMVWFL